MAYYYGRDPYDSFAINSYGGFQEHQDIEFERGQLYVIRYKYGFPYFIGKFHAYISINNVKIPTFKIIHKSMENQLRVGKFDRVWVHTPRYVYKKAKDFPRLDYLSLISISGNHARENKDTLERQQTRNYRRSRNVNGGKFSSKSKKYNRIKQKTKKHKRNKTKK